MQKTSIRFRQFLIVKEAVFDHWSAVQEYNLLIIDGIPSFIEPEAGIYVNVLPEFMKFLTSILIMELIL